MSKVGTVLLLCMAISAGVFGFESVQYNRKSDQLKYASEGVAVGQDKAIVLEVLGTPDNVSLAHEGELLSWSAAGYQGRFTTYLGLDTVKGHYETSVVIGQDGKVRNVWRGIN